MKKSLVLVMGILLTTVAVANAQQRRRPNPFTENPRVSPFINLLRQDESPSFLYLGEIRPQLQFRSL